MQIAVHFMGSVAEALLQLPEVPLRSAAAADNAAAPAGLWLTAGLLAADGFALQLRLKKSDKVRRDKAMYILLLEQFHYVPYGTIRYHTRPQRGTRKSQQSRSWGKFFSVWICISVLVFLLTSLWMILMSFYCIHWMFL